MALELSSRIKPLSYEEIKMMKEKGKAGTPIFQYPMA
jgi:hypothetical protein